MGLDGKYNKQFDNSTKKFIQKLRAKNKAVLKTNLKLRSSINRKHKVTYTLIKFKDWCNK